MGLSFIQMGPNRKLKEESESMGWTDQLAKYFIF